MVLTANVLEGTADRLGSHRGTGFLEDHEQLVNQFLTYCAGESNIQSVINHNLLFINPKYFD